MIGGIDEAGRGPVLGPLVVAGVSGPDQTTFRTIGCRDSKVLAPRARSRLAGEIRSVARNVETIVISPEDIDRRRADETLNEIEVTAFAFLARKLGVDELFVDAADVEAARFGRDIGRHLGREAPKRIVSEHRADDTYPIVSAASIVAKVQRDEALARWAQPHEKAFGLPVGSGYPHDETTIVFLEAYYARHGGFPAGTRRSWDTAKAIEARFKTRSLDEFLGPLGGDSRRGRRVRAV